MSANTSFYGKLGVASLHDIRAHELLVLLREAGDEPLSLATLRLMGIDQPGQTLYELELAGHAIERVYSEGQRRSRLIGVRLRAPVEPPPESGRRRRWRGSRRAA